MADAGPVVRVTVAPDLTGYTRLWMAFYWRRVGWVYLLVAAVPILLGVALLVAPGKPNPVPAVMIAAFGASFPIYMWFHQRLACRRAWEESPELRAEGMYEFSDDGVAYASGIGSSRVGWSIFKRVRVVAGSVVLFTNQGLMYYLPEAALSDDQREDLDDLLRAHVPRFVGLPARR